jgi:hypothetical protein
MPELDDLRSPSVVQLTSSDLSASDLVPIYHAATNTIRRIPAQDLGGLATNAAVVAAIEDDPQNALVALGQGQPFFQQRNAGLRETLLAVYEESNHRRVLATFKIPGAYAVEGDYKFIVTGNITLLINGGPAPENAVLGFVTEPRRVLGGNATIGNVFGFDLEGMEGVYVFHNMGDTISLDEASIGGSTKLILSGGFATPQFYSKLVSGGNNTNGFVVFEDHSFGDEPSYIEQEGEDFLIHFVLDCPAGPEPAVSYLVHWDLAISGYEYPGL